MSFVLYVAVILKVFYQFVFTHLLINIHQFEWKIFCKLCIINSATTTSDWDSTHIMILLIFWQQRLIRKHLRATVCTTLTISYWNTWFWLLLFVIFGSMLVFNVHPGSPSGILQITEVFSNAKKIFTKNTNWYRRIRFHVHFNEITFNK